MLWILKEKSYWTLCPTMKCFCRSRTSMCFRVSCYYKCTVYEFWWTCRKGWRLTAYRILKKMFPHRYRYLSHSTFQMHLSMATTNTAFVHVFSPWVHFSQGWCKRYLTDPGHSPIKQTKFALHVFLSETALWEVWVLKFVAKIRNTSTGVCLE